MLRAFRTVFIRSSQRSLSEPGPSHKGFGRIVTPTRMDLRPGRGVDSRFRGNDGRKTGRSVRNQSTGPCCRIRHEWAGWRSVRRDLARYAAFFTAEMVEAARVLLQRSLRLFCVPKWPQSGLAAPPCVLVGGSAEGFVEHLCLGQGDVGQEPSWGVDLLRVGFRVHPSPVRVEFRADACPGP